MAKKSILVAFAAVVLLCSCSTSESALTDLRALSNRINAEGSTYGLSEWKSTATEYYRVDKKIARHAAKGEYTNAEMTEIGELQGNCVSGFAKGAGQGVVNTATNAASLVKGFVDSMKKNFLGEE